MHHIQLLVSADVNHALGRFNQQALTDQMRMELLIDGLTDGAKRKYKDEYGDYLDVADWEAVEIDGDEALLRRITAKLYCELLLRRDTCARVFAANNDTILSGVCKDDWRIDTAVLPDGLEWFTFTHAQGMFGSINFCTLPSKLMEFDISDNGFSGSANLSALPEDLSNLNISSNAFSGSIALDNLPSGLECIFLSFNFFEGLVSLEALPESLVMLALSDCDFSGALNLNNLPKHIELLRAESNSFCGDLHLENHMGYLKTAKFASNVFSGVAAVHTENRDVVTIYGNKITAVVDEKGKGYACERGKEDFVQEIIS